MSISITLELPDSVANKLAENDRELSRTALEAIAVEGYRTELLSGAQVMEMLEFETRLELDAFLKTHGVELEYTSEDLQKDNETLNKLLN